MALVTIQRSPSPSNSPESEEDIVDVGSNRQRSFSENYFTVKGAALILPQSDCSQRSSRNNGGDIQQHLQQMFYLLRPEDTIKVAVKLESYYQDRKIWRYMAVVCCNGNQDTEESIILGLDLKEKEATIGLVLPIWANTKITLDGDGGFSVNSEGADYLFKPVSVQAMWSALQSLHKVINTANINNYIPKGLTHTWVEFYKAKINSDVSCIKEWNLMEDIESYAADSPYSSEKQELDADGMKTRISVRLRELMMSMDLEETTSKELRSSLEASLNMSLIEYKSYIDQEMMRILGQMDAPSEIFPFLYLGSEWNASNYDELEENGVRYILNVSREIDNFFPEKYHYMNVREFDNEQSDLMKHWKRTYEFIKKAKEKNGKVLVHCKMGISRSASTVIAFKMKEDGCSFQEAFNFVKDKRSVIRPNKAFMAQLEEYHGILTASRKRFLFGSKSSSEEVDMENESGLNQFGNEAHNLDGFPYYEHMDDPRFLPLDDETFAFEMFGDRDDLADFLGSGVPRVRAYTLDNTCNLPSKFKADDSWITLPLTGSASNLSQSNQQDQAFDVHEKFEPYNPVPTTSVSNEMKSTIITTAAPTSTCIIKPIASTACPQHPTKEDPSSKLSSVQQVSSTVGLDVPEGAPKTLSISKLANESSKISASSVPVDKEAEESEDQTMSCEYSQNNNNHNHNNNNNNIAVGEGMKVPVQYVKDDIPWHPGSVRKQREKMEEQIKSGTENDGAACEALKKDEDLPVTDPQPDPEQTQAPSSSISVMHSSPQKLKTSVSFSSFPVCGDEAERTPAGGGLASETVKVAERPQSVCLASSGKDLLAILGATQKDSLATAEDPLFDSMLPLSVYEMEDIILPAGIVRRTTKELEEKHRSSYHELTGVGLVHEEKTKNQPVQRSSSLGSERDRPRLERTKRRKTCTPILSPGNFGSSELLLYEQYGSLDYAGLDPDVGQDSKLLHPLYPAASMEDHLLPSYTEDSQVKDIMVYRYGAEQVEITGGSVRRRLKDYENLAKDSFDKDAEDVACPSEDSKQGTQNSAALGPASSSKTTPPSSSPPTTTTTTSTTVSTANAPMTTASKTSTSICPQNTAAVNNTSTNSTAAMQVTPKTLRKQEEAKAICCKSLAEKAVKETGKDSEPIPSKAPLGSLPSKTEKATKEQASAGSVNTSSLSSSSSSEEPSILSGCVTKMTKQIEQMSKEAPSAANPVKDLPSSKSHLFQVAAMSNALDSSLSCHLSAAGTVCEEDGSAGEGECAAVASKDLGLKKTHRVDENTAAPFEYEKSRLMKAKSLDESILAVPLDAADMAHSDGKNVRQLVGKFDPNLVKESETEASSAKSGDGPTSSVSSADGSHQPKMSEVANQRASGSHLHGSPSKTVPAEIKSVPRCSTSKILPHTFGAIDSPRSSAEISSNVGVPKTLASTSTVSRNTNPLPAATSFSATSSTATTTAVASVAMTTTSTATSSTATNLTTTAPTTANFTTANTKCATQTGLVNTQSSSVHGAQWWPQNVQSRAGVTDQAPCPPNLTPTTSTSVTSTTAPPAATHNVPPQSAAAAASSSTSPSWRPPFMSESRAFMQEGRKVRKLQGKTHPLSKLEGRQYSQQRNTNPSFYSTM